MGKLILKDAWIEIDGVDLSDHCTQVAVTMQKADVDMTNFGTGTQHAAGLASDSFALTLTQNFANGKVDATLYPNYRDETEFQVRVAANPAPFSATNPVYEGTSVLLAYPPISGSPGARNDVQVTLPVNGEISRELT